MLPSSGGILKQDFKVVQQPSKTFRIEQNRISGYVDGIEAVMQSIYCILNTERYDWLIYSWNYGVELKDLFGKPSGLVQSKLKKRIREALMQDDRISGVDNFIFVRKGRILSATFTVHTAYGEISTGKELRV